MNTRMEFTRAVCAYMGVCMHMCIHVSECLCVCVSIYVRVGIRERILNMTRHSVTLKSCVLVYQCRDIFTQYMHAKFYFRECSTGLGLFHEVSEVQFGLMLLSKILADVTSAV